MPGLSCGHVGMPEWQGARAGCGTWLHGPRMPSCAKILPCNDCSHAAHLLLTPSAPISRSYVTSSPACSLLLPLLLLLAPNTALRSARSSLSRQRP